MHNINPPPASELPSSHALLRSTAIAMAVAGVLLVTVVLPAEYGVDPTGIGGPLGLTEMGEIKMALAEEAEVAAAAEAATAAGGAAAVGGAATLPVEASPASAPGTVAAIDSAMNSHVTELTLAPGEGKEIKLVMLEGASVNFSWSVQGGAVNYDTHGDPVDAPADFYHGYERGTSVPSQDGVLVAAFDGTHGWFWRNRGDAVVTLTLRTEGDYQELRELY